MEPNETARAGGTGWSGDRPRRRTDRSITHRLPLHRFGGALAALESDATLLKAVIEPESREVGRPVPSAVMGQGITESCSRRRSGLRNDGREQPGEASKWGDDSPPPEVAAVSESALDAVRPLLRTRQVREFRPDPLPDDILHAITEVARWSGSSTNSQPWRFVVVRDRDAIRRLHEAGLPQTRALETAPAAVAIVLPDEQGKAVSYAYDEGRAAERMLIAAGMIGIAAGVTWITPQARPIAAEVLGLPASRVVRTIVAFGYPSDAAKAPKSAPGEARLPLGQVVFEERWPA